MTDHARRTADPLERTAAAGMAALGWLGAQWLTFAILKHSHVLSGEPSVHHHAYAGPAAAMAAIVTISAVAALIVRARFGSRDADPSSPPSPSPLRRTFGSAAGAAALFAAVETSEFAANAEHHLRPLALILVLGCAVQWLLALLARYACAAVLRAVDRLVPVARVSAATVITHREPAVAGELGFVARLGYGTVLPCRGPPAVTPA